MPAKAALFDQRGRPLHDFGNNFYNFVSFNSHGRLVALGGFGNLRGTLDIFDRRSLVKIATMDAENASFCQWSPDGRFILTATLSPRLRVDNGIKIWHCAGGLMHVESIDELYQASWRPILVDQVPQFGQTIPPAPAPHTSVSELATTRKVATPVKAPYRPPGARGLEASLAYRRDESGGSGQNTPTRHHSPGPTANGRRHVPGAPKSPSPRPDGSGGPGKKKQKGKGDKGSLGPGLQQQFEQNGRRSLDVNGGRKPPSPAPPEQPADNPDLALDANAKKVRNLNKKVSPIHSVCMRSLLTSVQTAEGDRGA